MQLAVTSDEVVAIFIYVLQPIFVLGADRINHIRRKILFCCKPVKSLACGPHRFGTCLELASPVDFTLLVSSVQEPTPDIRMAKPREVSSSKHVRKRCGPQASD